ncbi:ANTAR domain-containing response regulator [Propionispira raffinosivorans]|uniref:ANTAR domain-containing response regulator n=1 Tax=Propionispira raffinosivorans TaxID=86959 RepID=UPI00037BC6F5|nr:response regulator [Propionispira raffinosivorans]
MKTLSILLAEDEILIRADMKEALEEAGHIVCAECDNGKKAIEQAKQMQPELAILDIMMTELNGLETAQMMHELNIPVIMVTANSQAKLIQRAEKVHVYGYIIKPVSEQNLLAAVQIAYARWAEMDCTSNELQKMQAALCAQKTISKARSLIQDRLGISAQEAHRRLSQEAMKRQMTLAALAEKILQQMTCKNK